MEGNQEVQISGYKINKSLRLKSTA